MTIKKLNLKTSRAYHIKLNFQEFYNQTARTAETFLKKWYFWATHSRLEPMKKAAYTIKNHWDGVLRWFTSRINNGIIEGINSLIQAAKARARGYRTERTLITMIYLIAGKLKFDLPCIYPNLVDTSKSPMYMGNRRCSNVKEKKKELQPRI